jgi:hypothetical protein
MNGNTPVHDDNGHAVPLKEYIEALIEERDKAVKEALRQLEMRLGELNRLRQEVTEDRAKLLSRDVYFTEHKALKDTVNAFEDALSRRLDVIERDEAWVGRSASVAVLNENRRRLEALESWRGKAALIMTAVTILGGVMGAAIMRLFTGAFGI